MERANTQRRQQTRAADLLARRSQRPQRTRREFTEDERAKIEIENDKDDARRRWLYAIHKYEKEHMGYFHPVMNRSQQCAIKKEIEHSKIRIVELGEAGEHEQARAELERLVNFIKNTDPRSDAFIKPEPNGRVPMREYWNMSHSLNRLLYADLSKWRSDAVKYVVADKMRYEEINKLYEEHLTFWDHVKTGHMTDDARISWLYDIVKFYIVRTSGF